jgi:hypothetical protein
MTHFANERTRKTLPHLGRDDVREDYLTRHPTSLTLGDILRRAMEFAHNMAEKKRKETTQCQRKRTK